MHGTIRTMVLAIGTIASSWAAYQSALWSGETMRHYISSSAQRSESVRHSTTAAQLTQIDVNVFAIWAFATAMNNPAAADFLRHRFRPEFHKPFEAWMADAHDGKTPPLGTPFQRAEYRLAATQEAARLSDLADKSAEAGQHANDTGDKFVFSIVLFSMVTFLAGIEGDIQRDPGQRRRAIIVQVMSVALLLFALQIMLRLDRAP